LKGQQIPEMTNGKINEILYSYIELYEKITGEKFKKLDVSNIMDRI
jgi:phosphoribosylaminoimidazole-succinocarboxamide synthase